MTAFDTVAGYARRGAAYYRKNGARLTAARFFLGVSSRLSQPRSGSSAKRLLRRKPLHMLTTFDDAAAVDWTTTPPWRERPRQLGEGPFTTAWIMSPPGKSSGGHQNIFRFLSFLEGAGHRVQIFLYSSDPMPIDVQAVRDMLAESVAYPHLRAPIEIYRPESGVGPDADAIFATGWETAYPAYLDPSDARRFYFVQDFEPSFYPVGSENKLAENSYRFGFEAFTAGRWLAQKLAADYSMTTHPFDFATDLTVYARSNDARRSDVFFYARPVTTRRGFELGVMALAEVKRLRPQTTIHMAGWNVADWDIPFDYVNHGAMRIDELSPLYNRCAAALVMSLTNMSLLPLELLSCGTIPVVNDAPNNRLVSDNPNIAYTPLSPGALARQIVEILDDPDQLERSREAARSVHGLSWTDSGLQFVRAFEEAMHG
ncbi:glycosyltransferase [Actinomyces sp. B33]|uniref:rhamnosyltransferase WsaF family glycosyltransferase n=1 Tax=Actinomyces sp. B33 TaxID=2942131 RepID=UPI0023402BC7|nr:glycosyltransferase [Actinomyces sp. B33]MDC4232651.1 glycosyltransferase [Actinomyces sp. B33]